MSQDEPGDRLTRERAATASRIEAMLRERDGIVDSAALGATDDEHDPEGATLAFEREQISALLAQATARLGALDAALSRLEDGSYGTCVRCARTIPVGRLRARPESLTCVDCGVRA